MACKECYGIGAVRGIEADGLPGFVDCPTCCTSNFKPKTERYIDAAKIPKVYQGMELGNYDVTSETTTELHGIALFRAIDYANQSAENLGGSGILYTGPRGAGKTHLGVGILKHLIRTQCRPGLFVACDALIGEIISSFERDDITAYQVRFPVMTCDIVLLDDCGAGHITPWAQEELASIIQTRHRNELPTIITSNYPLVNARADAFHPDRFKGKKGGVLAEEDRTFGDCVGARAFSRILEMCTWERVTNMTGVEDYRKQVKHNSPYSWR